MPAEPSTRRIERSRAWALPLRLDGEGGFARARQVRDAVRLVVEVCPGERPLNPEFGCRLHSLPSIATIEERHIAAALVEEAVDRWIPRLGIDRVEVLEASESSLVLSVRSAGVWHKCKVVRRPPPEADIETAGEGADEYER